MTDTVLLSCDEMYQADSLATQGGLPGINLMQAAGEAITRELLSLWPEPRPVAVLCGPGNNGGDGFVVARLLKDKGWPVRLGLFGDLEKLQGDAAGMAAKWTGDVETLSTDLLSGSPLVVDALFGAGLARDIDGLAAEVLKTVIDQNLDVVAVDIPSGLHGDSGRVLGLAVPAQLTVTFFRAKPGHLLEPGRGYCGRVKVADIGISDSVLDSIHPQTFVNAPGLWLPWYPWPKPSSHKYSRGHGVVWGGAEMSGASRLAARGARRIGAGLLTLACLPEVASVYRAGDPGLIVAETQGASGLDELLDDNRKNAVLIGPGAGVGEETCQLALTALKRGKRVVLDADGLTSFTDDNGRLFAGITGDCVMTPHEGEMERLFGPPRVAGMSKVQRAREAAALSGAVIVYKGPDTVVAEPGGLCAINANAPADLATGGSGDVLAGMILGLLTQGMDAYRAALAGVWLHGAAAKAFGPGLIAEDISDALPGVLARVKDNARENGLL